MSGPSDFPPAPLPPINPRDAMGEAPPAPPPTDQQGQMAAGPAAPGHTVTNQPAARAGIPPSAALRPADATPPVAKGNLKAVRLPEAPHGHTIRQAFARLFQGKGEIKRNAERTLESVAKQGLRGPGNELLSFPNYNAALERISDPSIPSGAFVVVNGEAGQPAFLMIKNQENSHTTIPYNLPEAQRIVNDAEARPNIAENLLNFGTLQALSTVLNDAKPKDSADGAKWQLDLAQEALKGNAPNKASVAALHLTSALALMQDIDPKISNAKELFSAAKIALVQQLPNTKTQQVRLTNILTKFAERPGVIMRNPEDLHLLTALALQHNPDADSTKNLLLLLGFFQAADRTLSGHDVVMVATSLQELAAKPSAEGLVSPAQLQTLNSVKSVTEQMQGVYNTKQRNRDELGQAFIGQGKGAEKIYKDWPYQAKASAATLHSLGITMDAFKGFLQSRNVNVSSLTMAELGAQLENIGLVAELIKIKKSAEEFATFDSKLPSNFPSWPFGTLRAAAELSSMGVRIKALSYFVLKESNAEDPDHYRAGDNAMAEQIQAALDNPVTMARLKAEIEQTLRPNISTVDIRTHNDFLLGLWRSPVIRASSVPEETGSEVMGPESTRVAAGFPGNTVEVNGKQTIAFTAPKSMERAAQTMKMAIESNITHITRLSDPQEAPMAGKPDYQEYIPERLGDRMVQGTMAWELTGQEVIQLSPNPLNQGEYAVKSTLTVTDSSQIPPKSRSLVVLQYKNFRDRGNPNPDCYPTFVALDKQIEAEERAKGYVGPPAKHCKSGVGRTGLQIMATSPIFVAGSNDTINLADSLKQMRRGRSNEMVQNNRQIGALLALHKVQKGGDLTESDRIYLQNKREPEEKRMGVLGDMLFHKFSPPKFESPAAALEAFNRFAGSNLPTAVKEQFLHETNDYLLESLSHLSETNVTYDQLVQIAASSQEKLAARGLTGATAAQLMLNYPEAIKDLLPPYILGPEATEDDLSATLANTPIGSQASRTDAQGEKMTLTKVGDHEFDQTFSQVPIKLTETINRPFVMTNHIDKAHYQEQLKSAAPGSTVTILNARGTPSFIVTKTDRPDDPIDVQPIAPPR